MRLMTAFLRLFFHYFYHQFAWTYDFVAGVVSIGRWNLWVEEVIPFISGTTVLEVGYGPGHLQARLASSASTVFGIDESRQMAALALRRLRSMGKAVIALTRGRAQELPFSSQAFDTVVSTFPSEYIFQPQTLGELARVLRGGGRLVILPGASIVGREQKDRLAAWVFRITHQAPQTPEDVFSARLEKVLQAAGFSARLHTLERHASLIYIIEASKSPVATEGRPPRREVDPPSVS